MSSRDRCCVECMYVCVHVWCVRVCLWRTSSGEFLDCVCLHGGLCTRQISFTHRQSYWLSSTHTHFKEDLWCCRTIFSSFFCWGLSLQWRFVKGGNHNASQFSVLLYVGHDPGVQIGDFQSVTKWWCCTFLGGHLIIIYNGLFYIILI